MSVTVTCRFYPYTYDNVLLHAHIVFCVEWMKNQVERYEVTEKPGSLLLVWVSYLDSCRQRIDVSTLVILSSHGFHYHLDSPRHVDTTQRWRENKKTLQMQSLWSWSHWKRDAIKTTKGVTSKLNCSVLGRHYILAVFMSVSVQLW